MSDNEDVRQEELIRYKKVENPEEDRYKNYLERAGKLHYKEKY